MTDLTHTLTTEDLNPDWIPAPPIPEENNVNRRYIPVHLDRTEAKVSVQPVGQTRVLRVEQEHDEGFLQETVKIFFSATDPEVCLSYADALEEIAESLRDRASAKFAEFLAAQRREDALHELAEMHNDQSGFDSGYELTA